MNYKVNILGKTYDLPPRTLAVDDQIAGLVETDRAYQAGELTRREAVEQLHAFVLGLAPGSLPPVEEVDTNELMHVCMDVVNTYDAPARRARAEAKLAETRDILNKPEIHPVEAQSSNNVLLMDYCRELDNRGKALSRPLLPGVRSYLHLK